MRSTTARRPSAPACAQGDVIVAADGHDLAGLSQQASVDRVKGPPGSQVRLTWVRDGRR